MTLDLSLDQLSGNITEEQRALLLQSPNARVEAIYWPNVKIPGINAHINSCGLLAMPCIEAEQEVMMIHSASLDASSGKISFSVPLNSSKRDFPLKAMRIVLPFGELPGALRSELGDEFDLSAVDKKEARHIVPVWLSSPYRALGGKLVLSDSGAFAPNGGLPNQLASNSWDPPYLFYPRNRFAGYGDRTSMPFPVLQALKAPYPKELEGMERVYRAEMNGGWVDGHWLERVNISATRKKDETCPVSDLDYQILWVDGKLIHYAEQNSDSRPGQCRGWNHKVDLDNESKVIAFDDSVTNVVNMGTVVNYRIWNSTCSVAPQQPAPRCTAASPTEEQVSGLRQSASRVRQWFDSSDDLQQRFSEATR